MEDLKKKEEKMDKLVKNSKGKEKKKRKVPIPARIGIGFLVLVILVGVFGLFYIHSKLNKINRIEEQTSIAREDEWDETDETPAPTTNEEGETETIPEYVPNWPADIKTYPKDPDIINILLIGQDARPGETRQRSDSMMIFTINKKNNTLSLTSLMRDMYLQIPGYTDNRINASYAFGGHNLLKMTIAKNFGIAIDYTYEINFSGFTSVINAIGGVDVVLKDYEVTHLKSQGYSNLVVGSNHMNGNLALAYSRIRKVGHADYERTQRQRTVLNAVFAKFKDKGVMELIELSDTVLPMLSTDMSNNQILGLIKDFVSMGTSNISNHRLPSDGNYTSTYVRGMAVLVPDINAARADLKKIIYG